MPGITRWSPSGEQYSREMERVMGIEPTSSAWEAEVLPLNYTRMDYMDCSRVFLHRER
jgi:hypothetical protein